jgi:hypothetical protein
MTWDHHLDFCKNLIVKFKIYMFLSHNLWINVKMNYKFHKCKNENKQQNYKL